MSDTQKDLTSSDTTTAPNNMDRIVQYIVVRTDLNWNSGALMAQACHACVASVVSTWDEPNTKEYVKDLNNMHKIILKADNLNVLTECEAKLTEINVKSHMWIEKPEGVITCLAVSPQPRSLVQTIFKHLKLLR